MQLNEIDLWFKTMTGSLPMVAITYQRGSVSISGIKAIMGRSTIAKETNEGSYTEVESVDFVVKKAALKDLIAPQRGDLIRFSEQTKGLIAVGETIYEVIDPVSKAAEPYGRIIRVYGKQIAT